MWHFFNIWKLGFFLIILISENLPKIIKIFIIPLLSLIEQTTRPGFEFKFENMTKLLLLDGGTPSMELYVVAWTYPRKGIVCFIRFHTAMQLEIPTLCFIGWYWNGKKRVLICKFQIMYMFICIYVYMYILYYIYIYIYIQEKALVPAYGQGRMSSSFRCWLRWLKPYLVRYPSRGKECNFFSNFTSTASSAGLNYLTRNQN